MLRLKFINETYGELIIPVSKINLYGRYCDNINSQEYLSVLYPENPREAFTFYKNVTNIPTYDDIINKEEHSKDRLYYYEKNKDIKLEVHFTAIERKEIEYTGIEIYFELIYKNLTRIAWGFNYEDVYPYNTGATQTAQANTALFYEPNFRYLLASKAHSAKLELISYNKINALGIEYGDDVTRLGLSTNIPLPNVTYIDKEQTFDGESYSFGTNFYGEDLNGTFELGVYLSREQNYKKYSIYEIILESGEEEEEEKDPNEDDDPDDDEDKGGDGDHDDESDPIPEPELPPISASSIGLTTVWCVSNTDMEELGKKLWKPDLLDMIKQYFSSPLDAILSLNIVPVAPITTTSTIHLGGYNTEISSNRVLNEYIKFNLGSIPIRRYYGSYLDYTPFTKISAILPYIGEVDINPDEVMDTTVSCSYHINCVTGECIAYLKSDDNVFATYSGSLIKQIPIAQTDMSNIINSVVQIGTTALTAVAGAVAVGASSGALLGSATASVDSLSAMSALNSAPSPNTLISSVMSSKLQYKHSSQLGSSSGQLAPQFGFLRIERPNLDLATDYKSFVGYPCNKNLQLSSLTGFSQIEASNLSVPTATIEETSEIKTLLLQGVIF